MVGSLNVRDPWLHILFDFESEKFRDEQRKRGGCQLNKSCESESDDRLIVSLRPVESLNLMQLHPGRICCEQLGSG